MTEHRVAHRTARPNLDDFKPIGPPAGRDWILKGYGIFPCTCARCAPPTAVTNPVITDLDKPITVEAVAHEPVTETELEGAPHV
jgi:hypothetical protein